MLSNTHASVRKLLHGFDSRDDKLRYLAAHVLYAAMIATSAILLLVLMDFSNWTTAPRMVAAALLFIGLAWAYRVSTQMERQSHAAWASAAVVVLEWMLLACMFPAFVWIQRKLVPSWLLDIAYSPGQTLAPAIEIATCLLVLVGLPLSTARYVRRSSSARMASELAQIYERMAFQDALTNLPNRRGLERYATRAAISKDGLGVLMIDVNRFKFINDSYGHNVGDLALQAVAEAIRAVTGDRAFAARLAGDEFVVGLKGAPESAFLALEADVRSVGHAITVNPPGQPPFTITLSVGAAWSNSPGVLNDVLRRSDAAMYEDKQLTRMDCPRSGRQACPISSLKA